MKGNFEVIYQKDVVKFFDKIGENATRKILYSIDRAKLDIDNRFFKKITNDLWEFRASYKKEEYRLLSFWDKERKKDGHSH